MPPDMRTRLLPLHALFFPNGFSLPSGSSPVALLLLHLLGKLVYTESDLPLSRQGEPQSEQLIVHPKESLRCGNDPPIEETTDSPCRRSGAASYW